MERELGELAENVKELEQKLVQVNRSWSADKEKWSVDVETMRMKLELDGLKQLEKVRRQFDKERERHCEELERGTTLVMELKEKLAALESAAYPGDSGATSESHGARESGLLVREIVLRRSQSHF